MLWLLQGRRVVAVSAIAAAIENASGAVLTYRKKREAEAQPRCVAQLSCINSPSTPHTIKAIRAVAARYSAIVMIAPV